MEEIQSFVSRLYQSSGKKIMLREQLSRTTLSTLSRIVLGKNYFNESELESTSNIITLNEFLSLLDELFFLSGVFNIGDWIPWLDFLDLQGYVKRMKTLRKKLDRFYHHVIDEHNKRRLETEHFEPNDMVDLLLQLINDDSNLDVKLNYDSVMAFIGDLIAGGTDTSATSTEWAMSELMKNPDVITKATEELDRVIGRERWVEEKDIPHLPYIDAIMKETMRKHPVVVFLVPHLALEDCKVAGYDIPKGTRVFVNSWSLGRQETIWDAPEEFRPERFLGKAIDVKGQNFEFLPFGSGRRMCPGYSLGLKMISSMIANLLHGFNWKLPENLHVDELNMEEHYGLTTPRKEPLVAIVDPRLPLHLY